MGQTFSSTELSGNSDWQTYDNYAVVDVSERYDARIVYPSIKEMPDPSVLKAEPYNELENIREKVISMFAHKCGTNVTDVKHWFSSLSNGRCSTFERILLLHEVFEACLEELTASVEHLRQSQSQINRAMAVAFYESVCIASPEECMFVYSVREAAFDELRLRPSDLELWRTAQFTALKYVHVPDIAPLPHCQMEYVQHSKVVTTFVKKFGGKCC